MSQPLGNVGLSSYIYSCSRKKQYLCFQSSSGSRASNFTLGTNLEPNAFTTGQGSGLAIEALSTATVNQFNASVYVKAPEE